MTGDASFGADLGPESLGFDAASRTWTVFVRSTAAHGTLRGVDTDEAMAAPGVVAVVTAADVDVFPPDGFAPQLGSIFAQPLLAEAKVRYVGEPIAAVIAESPAEAIDAAELVVIDIEPLPVVLELDDALEGSTLLFDDSNAPRLQPGARPVEPPGSNVALTVDPIGSERIVTPSPVDDAAVVVSLQVMNPRMSPAPIEGRSVTCAWSTDGRLTVWASTQRPHGCRNELSELYGVDPAHILVIAPDVGGGFGGKNSRTAEEWVLPFLARRVGRPVTWIEDRSENLAGATHGRGERFDLVLGGSDAGEITGLRVDMVKDCGAYPITGAVLPGAYTAPNASGPYAIDHVEFAARCVVTNRTPISAFRGAGRGPLIAALERLVDRYAATIGIDPAEVRRLNLVRREQMPYDTPTGGRYDEADYPGDLERALDRIGYEQLRVEQARRRAASGPNELLIGIGIGCYNHMTVGGGGEEASVTILADGGARIVTGSTTQGHGHDVTWAQLASDVLAIPVERIEVIEGRTDLIATGVGAVGSRSLQTAGMAVHRSATAVVGVARDIAAQMLEAAPGDVVLAPGGRFHVIGTPARSVGWVEVSAASTPSDELSCGDLYETDGRNTYPSGTHVAVVEIDAETGHVDLLRFVAVDDAGTLVNPMIVEGQLHGGIASGVGQVLGETVRYDEAGNLITSTFLDYGIASADELPSFEVIPAAVPTSFNELGVKGVGESGTIGATAAVHNAIVDAVSGLGVTHIELPCTAERVWEAIRSASHFDS
ncbi:MAG: xanthine dehydrogenase family protein molybdopterin-binding subunit [Acidimicrobiales bacterium]